MYFITVNNWRKKLIYFMSVLLLLIIAFIFTAFFLTGRTVNSDNVQNEENILSEPIKVQKQIE